MDFKRYPKAVWTAEDDQEFERLQAKDDKEGLTENEIAAANKLFDRKMAHLYQTDPVLREVKDEFMVGVGAIAKAQKLLSLQEQGALLRCIFAEAVMKINASKNKNGDNYAKPR